MKKRTAKKAHNLLLFLSFSFVIIWFLTFLESRFTPIIKEISHMYCKSYANQMIDSALNEILSEEELKENHSKMPHGGFVIRSGKTGLDENTNQKEVKK